MNSELVTLLKTAKTLNEERLNLDRQSKDLKKKVDELHFKSIAMMRSQGVTSFREEGVSALIEKEQKPYISDWNALQGYIKEHDATDLLQKRLTESAVKLRWDDGIAIPGVGVETKDKLVIK